VKGPGIRLDLEVRREWECPLCGKRRRATGDVVALRCGCTRDKESMKLLEGQRQTRSFAEVIERIQSASTSAEPPQPAKPEPAADDNPPSEVTEVGEATQTPADAAVEEIDATTPPDPETPTPETPDPETPTADENS